MNIFYFTSDLFASVMAVSMVSVLETNSNFQEINFYIVDDGIDEKKKIEIIRMVDSYRREGIKRELFYLEAPEPDVLFGYKFKSRYQMGRSYYRMGIGKILPESVHRVLCLDCDTLVCDDLSELWDIDFGNNILAGVSDCMNIRKYKRQFRMPDNAIYCNAGVYMVDLDRWRAEKIEDKISQRIKEQEGNVFFYEQTLMNWGCSGTTLLLKPEYNVYTLFWAFDYENLIQWRKPIKFYADSEIEEAKRHPKIIHFTRNFYMLSRPWIKGCDHPMTESYMKYKKKTPWPEMDEDNRSSKDRKRYAMWHKIDQGVLSAVASVIYNEVRPRMWWRTS